MAQPRALILRAPGTNCDSETAYAFERAGARCDRRHVNQLLEYPRLCAEYQILCLPGGFSYGDDIAAGRILGNQLRHHLAEALGEFKAAGKLILGICNGLQILIRSGLLLEDDPKLGAPATLTRNDSGKFEARWVRLVSGGSTSVFFAGIESMYLPVAHAEGKFVPRDDAVLQGLLDRGQVVLRYASLAPAGGVLPDGASVPYPENPNGSLADIAGVCDATGRVCGLMPHPERYLVRTQHPRWTRGEGSAEGDGLRVFQNAVRYFS